MKRVVLMQIKRNAQWQGQLNLEQLVLECVLQ